MGGTAVEYTATAHTCRDAIDWFADEIRRDPARIEDLKDMLRAKIGLVPALVSASPATPDQEDPEDFWNNVPV